MIVGQSAALEDYSAVASASFSVMRPDGVEDTWTASILAQSATSITLQHTFDPGDVDVPGTYRVLAVMDGGAIRSEPASFDAYGKYEVTP